MNRLFFLIMLTSFATFVSAQKQTFDIATFTTPNGWTEKQEEDKISYSRIDGGSWAQMAIYKSSASSGNIESDFDKDWNELVAGNKTISSPEKTKPKTAEGWTVMSGSGIWQYNGTNVATILTTYSNGQTCISILCNATAKPYLKEYKELIVSLDLAGSSNTPVQNSEPPVQDTASTSSGNSSHVTENSVQQTEDISIVGLWTSYVLETNGYSINGSPQYTAGYLRREYNFYADGTYLFRNKQWLVKAPSIVFQYETGTYKVNGNQLTLTPGKGKAGFWNKTKSTKEWGSLIKSSTYNLEKTTYTFQIIIDNTYGNSIVLKSLKPTQRDGGQFNGPNDPYEFHYSFRKLESSIDNPPGWKN